jgi:hypothetical protein
MTVIMSAGIVQPGSEPHTQTQLAALAQTARMAQAARKEPQQAEPTTAK